VTEVAGMEGDIITLQDLFAFDYSMGYDENGKSKGSLRSKGLRPKFSEKLTHHGVNIDPRLFMLDGPLR
jgi:pilus assembly protein CpaF